MARTTRSLRRSGTAIAQPRSRAVQRERRPLGGPLARASRSDSLRFGSTSSPSEPAVAKSKPTDARSRHSCRRPSGASGSDSGQPRSSATSLPPPPPVCSSSSAHAAAGALSAAGSMPRAVALIVSCARLS